MRIVHVISSLGYGGAEQLLYDLLSAFDKQKNEHHVIYLRGGHQVERIEKLGIKTYQVTGLVKRYDPVALFRLYRMIKHLKPDVIHSALWSANILSRLVGWWLGIPVMSDQHGSCHRHGWFRNKLDAYTAHIPAKHIMVSNSVMLSFEQAVLRQLREKKAGKIRKQIQVIQNGIDCDGVRKENERTVATRSELSLTDDDFVIGSVGRFKPVKGYDVMIKGFARFVGNPSIHSTKLVLIGDGPERASLEQLAKDLGIDQQVIFAGYRDDARRLYTLYDVFALSSHSEGLSIALLEAGCLRVPVVTTHDGPVHEVITNEVNGSIVPVNDPVALADAFTWCYHNQGELKKKGRVLSEHVLTNFTMTRMVSEYEKVYRSLLYHRKA